MKTIKVIDLLNKIANGEAPKRIRKWNFDFFRDYELISYTSTIHRMYKSEDGTFLMDLVKITDEVEILDEEEFEDIEEINNAYYHESQDRINEIFKNTINQLIKNQKKIIERLKDGE